MISSKVPKTCNLDFKSIIILTKKPISPVCSGAKEMQTYFSGVLIPVKKVSFEGETISCNVMVERGSITARLIRKIRGKVRGSNQHHRFAYRATRGIAKSLK